MAADTAFWPGDMGLCLDPSRTRSNAFCNQMATDNSHAWLMDGWRQEMWGQGQKTAILRIFERRFVVRRPGVESWFCNLYVVWLRARHFSNVLIYKMDVIHLV